MNKDTRQLTREHIIDNPGKIAAQIIINNLIDNRFDMYMIGNTTGNSLYTVQLNNKERAIVGFTTKEILESYVNRKKVSFSLKKMFGTEIVCVQMNICMLYKLLNEDENASTVEDSGIRTVIINPNNKDFFIPLHINTFSEIVMENNIISSDELEDQVRDNNLIPLSYDKEVGRYCFFEENNF